MQLDLRQILNGLRKRWWLALLVMIAAAAVAYLYENAQPRVYQAAVTVQAQVVPPDNALSQYLSSNISPASAILTSKDFLQNVVDGKVGSGDPIRNVDVNNLAAKIQVQPRPDSRTIAMTVDNPDGYTAALLADRIADAFVERMTAQNQDNPGGSRIVWSKLQTPDVPQKPYQPRPLLYGGAAAVFGLILGLLLAIGLELLDTTLKSPADIRQYVDLNTLGVIPRSKVQSPRSKVQGPRSKVQSPRSKVQGPKSKVQSPGSPGHFEARTSDLGLTNEEE